MDIKVIRFMLNDTQMDRWKVDLMYYTMLLKEDKTKTLEIMQNGSFFLRDITFDLTSSP